MGGGKMQRLPCPANPGVAQFGALSRVGPAAQPLAALLVAGAVGAVDTAGRRKNGGKNTESSTSTRNGAGGDAPAGPSSSPTRLPRTPSCSRLVPGEQTAGPGGKRRPRASRHLVSRRGREVRGERKECVINRGDSSRAGAAGWQAAVTWHCWCVLFEREREQSANC